MGCNKSTQGAGAAGTDPANKESKDNGAPGKSQEEMDDEEERKKIAAMANRGKRNSVSGTGASENEIRNYVPPTYPKSDASKALLVDTLKSNTKMQTLGLDKLKNEHLLEIVMAFEERKVAPNEDVIKQGEPGDCLYIIESGTFDIYVSRKAEDGSLGEPVKVASFGPAPKPNLFGELAILYNSPRAATVRCAEANSVVWKLDGTAFQMLIKKHGIEKVEQYSGWLTNVDILKVLNLHEISQLADACESVLVDKDEVLMKVGDPGDAFFILEEGTAAAYFVVDGQEKVVKTYEKQGDYFGELALINNAPRKATVRATSDAVLLKIEKETFENMLGPIFDRLKGQAEKYPQLADLLNK